MYLAKIEGEKYIWRCIGSLNTLEFLDKSDNFRSNSFLKLTVRKKDGSTFIIFQNVSAIIWLRPVDDDAPNDFSYHATPDVD